MVVSHKAENELFFPAVGKAPQSERKEDLPDGDFCRLFATKKGERE